MTFVDTFIEVLAVNNDIVKIRLGPQTYEIAKETLRQFMNAEGYDWLTLFLMNAGIALNLSAVDIQDDVKIKQVIESRTFKLPVLP